MINNILQKELRDCVSGLNEENKQYILAISQALLFAQRVPQNQPLSKEKI